MNKGMKGFTIIELIVSIAIFAFMTALVIAKYGTFNQNTLLTNMAYDMAITVRTAQSYGLSVKSADATQNVFSSPYGIHFDMLKNDQFILFADKNQDYRFNVNVGDDEAVTTYKLNSGVKISSICLADSVADCGVGGDGLIKSDDSVDIIYKRPNPDAIFNCKGYTGLAPQCHLNNGPVYIFNQKPVAIITLTSADKSTNETVYIRRNGQISVRN